VTGSGICPIHTGVLDTGRPSFRWKVVEGAESYRFLLFSGSKGSRKQEWAGTTKVPGLMFPDTEPPPKPGTQYTWSVLAKVKGKEKPIVLVADAEFSVMDEDMARALRRLTESKDSGDWLLAAFAYEAISAYDLAVAQYERVARARPSQGRVLLALESLYELARDEVKLKEIGPRKEKLWGPDEKKGTPLTPQEEVWIGELLAAEKKARERKLVEKEFREGSHDDRKAIYKLLKAE
jgi:hypothetical protein